MRPVSRQLLGFGLVATLALAACQPDAILTMEPAAPLDAMVRCLGVPQEVCRSTLEEAMYSDGTRREWQMGWETSSP